MKNLLKNRNKRGDAIITGIICCTIVVMTGLFLGPITHAISFYCGTQAEQYK
jgi:flagellar biosynthesis component FlhA